MHGDTSDSGNIRATGDRTSTTHNARSIRGNKNHSRLAEINNIIYTFLFIGLTTTHEAETVF